MLFASFLGGCNNEALTYDYLMQHPAVLQKEIGRCEAMSFRERSNAQNAQCKIVADASNKMTELVTDQHNDPQEFGQRILDLQMASALTKQELVNAQTQLDALKAKHASEQEIDAQQKMLLEIQKAHADQDLQVKTLLAVVGIESPE